MSVDPRPWERLRDLEPPLGAKRRLLSSIEDELAETGSKRKWLFALVPITAAAIALIHWSVTDEQTETTAPTEAVIETAPTHPLVSPPAPAPASKPATAPPSLTVPTNERIAIALPKAEINVRGPAKVAVADGAVTVTSGTLEVRGATTVSCGICKARINGKARIRVTPTNVQVSVFAGTAEVLPGTAECTVHRVLSLKPKEHSRTKAKALPPPKPETKPTPSALRAQVEQFRRIRALTDRTEARKAWQAFLARWPDSPLRSEAAALLKATEGK